tara:strand:- start:3757 stop:4422 length:666 start_codon:yes stop_codon:yes gene_type:complete
MITSLHPNNIFDLVLGQLRNFYPDGKPLDYTLIKRAVQESLERLEFCFQNIENNYYRLDKKPYFNHLNTDHWCSFLWFLSNQIHDISNHHRDAEKLFGLNKALHGIDVFYSVDLPNIFLFVHPLGTILGKAKYSNYLVVYQNVTVGSDLNNNYPEMAECVALMSKSSVLGSSKIGKEVWLSANSMTCGKNIPDNSAVFGVHPGNTIKTSKRSVKGSFFLNT